jgi:hypothetical protein
MLKSMAEVELMPAIFTPLVDITVASIYNNNGPLPKRLARCTPDTKAAINAVAADLAGLGHHLRLSDLFRSHDMQKAAHDDFVQGRKKAFSPPPGGSMHEAGRAMDIDLSSIGVSLAKFWEIAKARGFEPIIDKPEAGRSESWHFDCRGSHNVVYRYVQAGKAGVAMAPYTQMAQSGIAGIGVVLDTVPDQGVAMIQSALIRLGLDPGRIDGLMGDRTKGALRDSGADKADPLGSLCDLLRKKFPGEFGAVDAVKAG